MSAINLTATGVSVLSSVHQLLHIGTGSATSCTIYTGDGTATCLALTATGITVTGGIATGTLTVTGAATAASLTLTGAMTSGSGSISGALTVGGASSLAGPLVFSGIQTLSGAGAIDPSKPTTVFTSTGASQALTLAAGTNGQVKTIIHAVDGGSGVLNPTAKTGFSTITFSAAGDSATLQYLSAYGWIILAVRGASVS